MSQNVLTHFVRVDEREKMISLSLQVKILCPLKQESAVPNVNFAKSDTILFLSPAALSCLYTYNQKRFLTYRIKSSIIISRVEIHADPFFASCGQS